MDQPMVRPNTISMEVPTGIPYYMGVSKIWGIPQWMVYNGKTYKNG